MARQVLPLIDLRTQAERQGITSTQQTVQAITNILSTLGQAEKKRRERQTLDRIARAIGSGATDIEAIAEAARQTPEFGGGIQGILQKIGGVFQPPGAGGIEQNIQQAIIGQALQRALTPKPEIPKGLEPSGVAIGPKGGVTRRFARPEAGKEPFEQTKAEKSRNRDTEILTKKDKSGQLKASPAQEKAARRRLRKNPSLQDTKPGQTDYSDFLTGKPKVKVKGATFDKAFGKEAYNQALQEIKDQALTQGIKEVSAESDFNAWWDENATVGAKGQPGFGRRLIPRSEFQDITEETEQQTLDIAPTGLEDVWDTLSDEEKATAKRALAAGRTAEEIKALL